MQEHTRSPARARPQPLQGRGVPAAARVLPRPTAAGCACGGGCPACGQARLAAPGEAEAHRLGGARPATARRTPPTTATGPGPAQVAVGGGQPLAAAQRAALEAELGADFSRVRVHADDTAAHSATALRADAYTLGGHIVFGPGQYRPGDAAGQALLRHELTHTVQQGAAPARPGSPVRERLAPRVQGSFWDDVVSGVSAVGNAIGQGLSAVGSAVGSAFEWLGDRVRDVAQWAIDLVGQLPARLLRLGQTLVEGFWGVLTFIPGAIRALASGGLSGLGDYLLVQLRDAGFWALRLLSRVFDVLGGPEALEFVSHLLSRATPLRGDEIAAASAVLGPQALNWGQVRVAEGGFLHLVFALNGGRAFTSFHTINIPSGGAHGRSHMDIMVHELMHVMQYERVGTLYLGQAIHAQLTVGYSYGGAQGLRDRRAAGGRFADLNREQQGQVAQDFYRDFVAPGVTSGADYDAYRPYIDDLQAGRL